MKFTLKLLTLLFPILSLAQDNSHEASGQAIQISFSDLNKLVSEKNENVKASRVMIESSEARTGHLTRSFLPQISASVGEESFKVTSQPDQKENYWRVGAQVNLYRGGRDRLEEVIRDNQVEVSKIGAITEGAIELKKAQDAYWNIVAQTKLLDFRKEELKANEQNIKSAARRAGAGVATNADRVQFELNKAELGQAIETLNLELDFAKNQLAVLLGLDQHGGIKVKDDFPQVSKTLPKSIENQKRLAIRSMELNQGIEKARASAANQWWQPSLDAYASYGIPSLDDEYERSIRRDHETVAGVRLTFDLGQGLKDYSEGRSKSLESKALAHRLAYTIRQTEADAHELEHHMLKSAELISQADKNLEKARTFLSLTKTEYQRGVKNGPDLMSASRMFFDLNERKVLLTRQYLEHRSALEALNASLGEK